jgi:hypothetical protein
MDYKDNMRAASACERVHRQRKSPNSLQTGGWRAGKVFIARAQVKRAGRKLTVCTADIFALRGDKQNVVATMLATIMAVPTAHAK